MFGVRVFCQLSQFAPSPDYKAEVPTACGLIVLQQVARNVFIVAFYFITIMLDKKTTKLTIGVITFIIGIFMLINSQSNITGASIGIAASTNSFLSSFLGVMSIVSSIILFAPTHFGLEKILLSSAIKRSPPLLRLAQDAVRNETVERELNHLVKELSKANFEAGLGHPGHIEGTGVYYLRGRNGGRLYYHRIGEDSYEIVAKSAKGTNQNQVINKIGKTYGN